MTSFAYDRETAIRNVGPGRWLADIGAAWNINVNPNGGYAQAPLLKAMAAEVAAHPDPASATTHYLRPAVADEQAEISVEVIRQGRRTSTVRGMMVQQDKVRLESIATFIDLGAEAQSDWQLDIAPPPIAPPQDCLDRALVHQDVDLPLLSRVEVLVDPASVEPARDGEVGAEARATVSGWIRFADERPIDSMALTLLADCFPPSIFSAFGRVGWVPTIELTVHVRRRPVPGWIQARFVTSDIAGATLVEDGTLWDESGAVVAQARQLALVAN